MASLCTLSRSNSNGRTSLIAEEPGGASHRREIEGLSISKSLARSVSDKLRKQKRNNVFDRVRSSESSRDNSPTCLGFYVKGGGCRVVACDDFDSGGRRRPGSMDECMPQRAAANGVEESSVECFSYGVSEKFWRRRSRKKKESLQCQSSSASAAPASLPDDVLEMILARLPLASVMTARCVCKRWRYLTSTPRFTEVRAQGSQGRPWLFLFGVTRGGCHAGDVHALDVDHDRWHRISNDVLKGRFSFSVASMNSDIYVVGGCSTEKSSIKTHRRVLVFNPLSCSWRKAAPMRLARSGAVLGVVEVGPGCSILKAQPKMQDRLSFKPRIGASDVYEDPHRLSLRLRLRDAFIEEDQASENRGRAQETTSKQSEFALIAVGGRGAWDEPLESAEIYDPATDRWIDIASLPGEFGVVCSAAVCGQTIYAYSEMDKLAGYDIGRGIWTIVDVSRPPPRLREYYPKLVVCRNRLFLSCVSWCERDGPVGRRERAVRKLWEMDSMLHAWNEVSRHPDAPMDRNAVFVADESMIYTVEMFRIFGQVLDFLTACHVSEAGLKWTRVSRKHAAYEVDSSSCSTKSMLVLHL